MFNNVARVGALSVLGTILSLTSVFAGTASASSIDSVTPASGTQQETSYFNIAGSATSATNLYVTSNPTPGSCAARFSLERAKAGNEDLFWYSGVYWFGGTGAPTPVGAFNRQVKFSPDFSGGYRICAYLSQAEDNTPEATGSSIISVSPPAGATIESVQLPSDPVVGGENEIRVTGTSETLRSVYVTSSTQPGACYETPALEAGLHGGLYLNALGSYGTNVPHGPFEVVAQAEPTSVASRRICVFLSRRGAVASPPVALVSPTLKPRIPTANLSVSPTAPYLPYTSETLHATTTLEHPSVIAYDFTDGQPCAPYSLGLARQTFSAGTATLEITTPRRLQNQSRLCAWILEKGGYADGVLVNSSSFLMTELPLVMPSDGSSNGSDYKHVSFRWANGSSGDDTLVLSKNGKSQVTFTTGGTFSSDPDAEEVDKNGQSRKRKPDPRFGKVVVGPTHSVVALTEMLTPGTYTWHIERDRYDGESIRGPEWTIRVLPPKLLRVALKVKSLRGRKSWRPGKTNLSIAGARFAHAQLRVRVGGRTLKNHRYDFGGEPRVVIPVKWTCKLRHFGKYRYALRVWDDRGRKFHRSGMFRGVSKERCKAMISKERAKRRKDAIERKQAEQRARENAVNRCNRAGGVPVDVDGEIECRSPYTLVIIFIIVY